MKSSSKHDHYILTTVMEGERSRHNSVGGKETKRKGKRFRHEVTSRVSDRSGQVCWWELGTMVVKLFRLRRK